MAEEEEKVINSLKLDTLESTRNKIFDLIGRFARNRLYKNKTFQGLSEKNQRIILKGRTARDLSNSPFVTNPFGLNKQERDGIYRLLSNCAHSTAYGMRVTSGYYPVSVDSRYVLNISILCSIHFLAFSMDNYLKKRWRIAKEISFSDREFIRKMVVPDLISKVREMQVEHIKDIKEKRFQDT